MRIYLFFNKKKIVKTDTKINEFIKRQSTKTCNSHKTQ